MITREWMVGKRRLSLAVLLAMLGLGIVGRAGAQGEKTAVIINGEIITEADFFDRLQRVRASAFVISDNPLRIRTEPAGQIVLDSMIVERLTLQAANRAKVALTDQETNAQLANLKAQPNIVAGLTGHLYTEEMLKYDIQVQGARFKLATVGVKVNQEEIEKYYKAHLAEYTVPEQWALSVIRTGNPDTLAKIQADLKGGKSFADTAKLYSEDTATKEKGGDIGMISATDPRFPAALRDAVKPLKLGEITQPVKLELDAGPGKAKIVTWWLLLLKGRSPETVRTLDEMKIGVERFAMLEKAGGYQAGDRKIAELRSQSDIKINLPGYDALATRH